MKRTFSLSSTLALLVALTGCGDDDPTGSTGGDLTEGEAHDEERDSNVIEVLIGRLRRKIDAANQLNPIETLRGRGYRFSLEAT